MVCNEMLAELKEAGYNQNIIKLSVDIQLPGNYYGDPLLLKKCIENICIYLSSLLINGVIHIELTSRGGQSNLVGVHVLVTGLGSSRTSPVNKSDVDVILKHSGFDITCKTSDEKVTFEFDHALKSNAPETNSARLPFDKMKILIAEDNEINAMVFSSFLEDWGIETLVVINGAEAVSQVHNTKYDAVLMDIHMPILNGNQATKKIRDFNHDIPIIALTASTREQDCQEALASGANACLIKPVSSTILFQVLSKYL